MQKIASPQQLQTEIARLLAYAQGTNPSREILARDLNELADRVDGRPVEAAKFQGPQWLEKALKRHKHTYANGTFKIEVGDQEKDANRLEDKINAEANRMKSTDSDKGYEVEAWGTQDPKSGKYTINIQV